MAWSICLAAATAQAFSFTKVVDATTPVPGAPGRTFNVSPASQPAVAGNQIIFLNYVGGSVHELWSANTNIRLGSFTKQTGLPGGHGNRPRDLRH